MKKLFKLTALALTSIVSIAAFNSSYATSYQIFPEPNFANPAALNRVEKAQIMLGGLTLLSRFHFTGTAAGVGGTASSNTTDLLPYGRLAMRLSPKIVVGLDITQPYFTDIQYPVNSVIAPFATSTYIRDTNFSPKISYQATPKLAVGAGLDINNFYNGQLNFAVGPFPMTNKADSWAYGFDLGLFYVVTKGTYVNLTYYSKIVQHLDGVSTWGPFSNNKLSADVRLPATTILNVIQFLSPQWAFSGTIRYSQWDTVKYLVLQNTALPGGATITVPEFLYNNFSYQLATHYDINDKWGVLAAFELEPNITPTYTRNPGLPTYTRLTPAVGAEYEITKGLKGKLVYAHPMSSAPIDMRISTGQRVTGHEYLNVDAWDLSFTYDV